MRTYLAASLGATAGAVAATLEIQHVQRDLARMRRARLPLSFLSTSDLRFIARDACSSVERRIAATQEYEVRVGCEL
jgi:hypothetical protein